MAKRHRPRTVRTDRPANQGGRREADSKTRQQRVGASPTASPSVSPKDAYISRISQLDSPPLVVTAGVLRKAAEFADTLASCEPRSPTRNRGQEYWQALTDFAGIRATFLNAGHLNVLLTFTKSPNKNVRLYAAQAIVHIGGGQRSWWPFPEALTAAVLKAMENDDAEVRSTILPALTWFADMKLNQQRREQGYQCALRAFTDPDQRIRAQCLRVLPAFGIDRVSEAVKDIQALLSETNSQEVLQEACNLLGWLGADAIKAIDDLKRCVAPGKDDGVRRAAALAIAKINPTGDRLCFGSGDQALRADLVKLLREASAAGRALRRNLQQNQPNDSSGSASDPLDARLSEVLTPTQLKITRYLRKKNAPVPFQEVKNLWKKPPKDQSVTKMIYRTNDRLGENGIALILHITNGYVSVE